MSKLAISFITYNRAKHIKEDLDIIAQPTKECDIDLYIYDGSADVRTEYVVKQYMMKGYDHIHYFRTDKTMSLTDSANQRIINALIVPDAEYIWLCGDKFVIKPEYYSEILSYIDQSYDIITIYGGILKGTREFNKPSRFLDYAIVPITHFGSTIIRRELLELSDIHKAREENKSFSVPLIYLRVIANLENFKGIVIDGGKQVNISSQYQVKRGWQSCVWDTWVLNWYQFICLLPDTYENVRKNLFSRIDKEVHFFSIRMLLLQRSEDQLNLKIYMKCRKYARKIIIASNMTILGIAILPRSIAKWLYGFPNSKGYRRIRTQMIKLDNFITGRS